MLDTVDNLKQSTAFFHSEFKKAMKEMREKEGVPAKDPESFDLKKDLEEMLQQKSASDIRAYFGSFFIDDYDIYELESKNVPVLDYLNNEFIDIDAEADQPDIEEKIFKTVKTAIQMLEAA